MISQELQKADAEVVAKFPVGCQVKVTTNDGVRFGTVKAHIAVEIYGMRTRDKPWVRVDFTGNFTQDFATSVLERVI